MTANPIELIGGLATTGNVPKADIIAWGKARVSQVFADATEVRNTILASQLAILLQSTGSLYLLDAADTTTVDNGISCIVSSDGKRFKLASREKLRANRTYYVRTDGSDNNTGLVNSAGGSFLTIQKAIDVVAALDISIYNVTIQVAAGTYAGAITVTGPWIGSGTVTLQGDTTTPSNVSVSTGANICLVVQLGARLTVTGISFTNNNTNFALIRAIYGGQITMNGPNQYNSSGAYQVTAEFGGLLICRGVEIITGSVSSAHYLAAGGQIDCGGVTWQASGTAAVGTFAFATNCGVIVAYSNPAYSGTFTGFRYVAILNGVVNSNGGGANYFPGNAAGATSTGGQYS